MAVFLFYRETGALTYRNRAILKQSTPFCHLLSYSRSAQNPRYGSSIGHHQISAFKPRVSLLNRFYTSTLCSSGKRIRPVDYARNLTTEERPKSGKREQLKRAFAEYGSTLIVFHVAISLVSLGSCYLLVSSGVNMDKLLVPLGINSVVAANTGTFVASYALHKVFAPVRITITLTAVPFIVRYLRKINVLKPPIK